MPKLTGKDLFVSYAGTSLASEQRSFDVTEMQETADATAGADSYRNFINTVKTVEASMELIAKSHGDGGSAIFAALSLGSTGTVIYGPEGTATGSPRFGFLGRLVEFSKQLKFDDVYLVKLKWQNAGTAMIYNGVTDKF